MPPRRLRCKTKPANFLTRGYYFLVPVRVSGDDFQLSISNCRFLMDSFDFQIGNWQLEIGNLSASAEFFDKCYAVDFVQGRNPSENLLQGRVS